MTQETELYLEDDGFYAGRRLKDGSLGKGAHKITEDEIISMFAVLARTFSAKTGQDTMVMQGDDGRAIIARLVTLNAGAGGAPQKK